MTFLDTCKSLPAAHHMNCRKRHAGVWFRKSVNPSDPQFECPHGYDWVEDKVPEVDPELAAMAISRFEICKDCASVKDNGNGCAKHSGCCFGNKRAHDKEFHCPDPDKKW